MALMEAKELSQVSLMSGEYILQLKAQRNFESGFCLRYLLQGKLSRFDPSWNPE